jgi:GT2 family glycosyltransferase
VPGSDGSAPRVAIVVIGRNEALRLHDVLVRACSAELPIVYVDSASSDDSVAIAGRLGVDTLVLDESIPMSAARARNTGAAHLAASPAAPEYIQFIDGDCLLEDAWIDAATAALDEDPLLGAVCGWRREAEPRKNIFHEVVDMEWQMGAVGPIDDFAGDVMIRVTAFDAAGGYDPGVMAGEDTEFSSRMRAAGFTIRRLDLRSTVHDINMVSLRQWWQRNVRSGLGYGIVAEQHRHTDQLFLGRARRAALWGFAVPAVAVAALPRTRLPALAYLARLALSSTRAAQSIDARRAPFRQRLLWGVSCTTSDVPAALGLAKYAKLRLRSQVPTLVEYKHVDQ